MEDGTIFVAFSEYLNFKKKNPSTLPSLVYIIAELTLARLGKWFVLVTSFPCKKYSSFGEEHKQRKKCSLLLLRGYSQEKNWQVKLSAKVGIVNYRMRAIKTRGLYIFIPFLKTIFLFSRSFFFRKSCPYVWLVFT